VIGVRVGSSGAGVAMRLTGALVLATTVGVALFATGGAETQLAAASVSNTDHRRIAITR